MGKSQPTPISFVMGLFSVAFCTDIKYFSLSSNSLFWEKEQSIAHSQTRREKSPSHQEQSEDNQTCSEILFIKSKQSMLNHQCASLLWSWFGTYIYSLCCCELLVMWLWEFETSSLVKGLKEALSCLVAYVYETEGSWKSSKDQLATVIVS